MWREVEKVMSFGGEGASRFSVGLLIGATLAAGMYAVAAVSASAIGASMSIDKSARHARVVGAGERDRAHGQDRPSPPRFVR
jgi:hypothetical protein